MLKVKYKIKKFHHWYIMNTASRKGETLQRITDNQIPRRGQCFGGFFGFFFCCFILKAPTAGFVFNICSFPTGFNVTSMLRTSSAIQYNYLFVRMLWACLVSHHRRHKKTKQKNKQTNCRITKFRSVQKTQQWKHAQGFWEKYLYCRRHNYMSFSSRRGNIKL